MKPYLISNTFDLQRLYDADGKAVFDSSNLAIYVQATSPAVPSSNGIGVLADAVSCSVRYELNGQDELTMTYPVTGQLFDQIELRDLIVAEVGRRGNQPYRIYRITKPLNGVVTIYARHLAYDLAGIVVAPFSAANIGDALSGLKTRAMTNNPFTFITTRSTSAAFTVKKPDSVWALMGGQEGSLLDVYGGEYSFDGYTVRLENAIGSDNGVAVRYGVNMTDLEQDANCADCYTGVVAYWQGQSEGGDEDMVYSPVIAATGTYGYVKILTVDMSDRWEAKPTEAQLAQAARTYITANQIGVPKVSWRVGFVPLDMTEEYKDIAALERVSMGDTVTVKFEKLGVDATSRVRAIEWNVLLDRYISVELGSIKSNIAATIAKQDSELKKVPTTKQMRDLATTVSTTLTKAILGANGGSVRFLDTDGDGEEDSLYIANNKDPSLATKVWRFNYEGWGASANGYNGPFVLGATLDAGLLASFVTAANLTAGTIRSADGTTFVLDLDTGTLSIGGYAQSSAANASTQLIYISKASGTSSVTAPSGWITNTTGNQNTWTSTRPEYSSSYPVLFVATQRKMVDGSISCTTPQIDKTTTVIDGGHITTGQMSADRIYGGTLSLGGENFGNGKLVLLNSSGSEIGENDFLGLRMYSGLINPDKHIVYTFGRTGFGALFDSDGDGSGGVGVLDISAEYSGTSAHSFLALRSATGNTIVNTIEMSGETGKIRMKELEVNGHNADWTSIGTKISAGADILPLGPGRYYCSSNSDAASLINCPTSKNFELRITERNTSSNRKNYLIHDADNNIYINAQTGTSSYTGWKKITTTSV